ncbi:unnamed protein product [Brachionus calyciflorus]|uniref:Uncharacterized protein n=1 Tax=Brachionus calyciflorus TaxID=104777 RepID=A0A814I595_9BILA|nr:unnamed protein product [Brachionus calyciflorus]
MVIIIELMVNLIKMGKSLGGSKCNASCSTYSSSIGEEVILSALKEVHLHATNPCKIGKMERRQWLSELWNNFQSESITKSFITCGIKTHRINGDKIEIDFQNLHGPLKEMIKKNVVINSYIDDDNELEEANLIFTEENNIDIFGQGESQDAGLVDEQAESQDAGLVDEQAETSEQNKSPEFNGDGLMTSEEQRIFQNLEASVCQRRSEFILKDSTNKLNLNKIKKLIPVQENLEKENMVKYAEFQFKSTPSTSKSQEDKKLSKPTKRKTPEVEQEAKIPKKRGRKLGSKNKKTIEKEARMAEMVSKATNEESVI